MFYQAEKGGGRVRNIGSQTQQWWYMGRRATYITIRLQIPNPPLIPPLKCPQLTTYNVIAGNRGEISLVKSIGVSL